MAQEELRLIELANQALWAHALINANSDIQWLRTHRGHVNVDGLELLGVDKVHNLLIFPYPFDDESAGYIKAIDLLERRLNYTPAERPTVIAFVEECHRVLVPVASCSSRCHAGLTKHVDRSDPTYAASTLARWTLRPGHRLVARTYGYYSTSGFRIVGRAEINGNIRVAGQKVVFGQGQWQLGRLRQCREHVGR